VERAFRAPGRVNLIGEHTDYTGGLVLPAAVGHGVTVVGEAGGDVVELVSDRFTEQAVVRADGSGDRADGWGRYVAAVTGELAAAGRPAVGFRGRVEADLPAGAGLSSSAALEVAVALALCTTAGYALDGLELAELCRRAEDRAVGVPCGLMDQAASLLARPEHALLLDCGSLEHRQIAFPADLELLVVDSGVARSLDASAYAERRAEVESGVPKRLRHVDSENERVREVVAALESGDREALRAAFAAGHASLRDDFEVSTPLLDSLVETAVAAGAVAARLTGAGFGGSIVALVERGTGAEVGSLVTARHPGSTAYVSRPAGGAADVTPVRPARPEEAGVVTDLVRRAYGHYVERIGRRPSPMDADYAGLAAAGQLWTLEETAGVVLLREDDGHLLVDNLAVEPWLQGTGLGRRLLAFAEDEARRRGLGELRLYTNVAMTENIALYTRLDWEEYDRRLEGAYSRVYFRKAVGL
jgi:galactokinase